MQHDSPAKWQALYAKYFEPILGPADNPTWSEEYLRSLPGAEKYIMMREQVGKHRYSTVHKKIASYSAEDRLAILYEASRRLRRRLITPRNYVFANRYGPLLFVLSSDGVVLPNKYLRDGYDGIYRWLANGEN